MIAQSVGVGTNSPSSSAAMDVTSIDKGFLLPRMSQSQRTGIQNPENGLLVYDITFERLYQFQGWHLACPRYKSVLGKAGIGPGLDVQHG